MAHLIFVHGGLHGGWCWERVMPLMLAAGHSVEAIDLPGSKGEVPASGVTLRSYADTLFCALERYGASSVLVAHSLGGKSASLAAEARPDLVSRLIYVTALMPNAATGGEHMLAGQGESIVSAGFSLSADGASVMISEAASRAAFYSDCSEDDAQDAFARLTPQPVEPILAPVEVTEQRWGSVPRHYVFTQNDQTIAIGLQEAMVAAAPGTVTHRMASGHSPFYNKSIEFADLLISIVGGAATKDKMT